jgi:hypothetical protein
MSQDSVAYARGRLQGVIDSGWACGDCENVYDATVDRCPNQLLDAAQVDLRKELTAQNTKADTPSLPTDDAISL